MTAWVLAAPHREDDAALETSRWVAEQTATHAPVAPLTLVGSHVVRELFEATLREHGPVSGLAFFGHGEKNELLGADGEPGALRPILDPHNAHLLARAWVHAFACWSGEALANVAVSAGADIYVGYQRPLKVEWSPSQVPDAIAQPLVDLLTCTTYRLLHGEREAPTLRAAAEQAAEALVEALTNLPASDADTYLWGYYAAADQLVSDMVVVRSGPS